jgi:hypothetical protein
MLHSTLFSPKTISIFEMVGKSGDATNPRGGGGVADKKWEVQRSPSNMMVTAPHVLGLI